MYFVPIHNSRYWWSMLASPCMSLSGCRTALAAPRPEERPPPLPAAVRGAAAGGGAARHGAGQRAAERVRHEHYGAVAEQPRQPELEQLDRQPDLVEQQGDPQHGAQRARPRPGARPRTQTLHSRWEQGVIVINIVSFILVSLAYEHDNCDVDKINLF